MVKESDPTLIFSPLKIHPRLRDFDENMIKHDAILSPGNDLSPFLGKRPNTPTEGLLSLHLQDKCLMNVVDDCNTPPQSASISHEGNDVTNPFIEKLAPRSEMVLYDKCHGRSFPTLTKEESLIIGVASKNLSRSLMMFSSNGKRSSQLSLDRLSASINDSSARLFKATPIPKGIYHGPPRGIPAKIVRPLTIPKSPQFFSRKKSLNIKDTLTETQTPMKKTHPILPHALVSPMITV